MLVIVVMLGMIVAVIMIMIVAHARLRRASGATSAVFVAGIVEPAFEQRCDACQRHRRASSIAAPGLICRSRARSAARRSGVIDQVALVTTMRSATATCFTASSCASSVATPLTASTSGDDAVEPERLRPTPDAHDRLQHRRGIGKARGLDDDAAEPA